MSEPRRGIVQLVQASKGAFRKLVLAPGQRLTLGRDERAEVRFDDASLRGAHLSLEFDGVGLHLRELGGSGLLSVDGEPRSFGELHSAGWFSAGRLVFRFFLERRTPPPADHAPAAGVAEALAVLAPLAEAGTLWAVVDAARSSRVLELCEEAIDPHASLYEGLAGRELDHVAPYLVQLDPGGGLLRRLLHEGWGHAWGIYAQSSLSPKDVRRHFRRFLMAEEETSRERLYFRFYDPRVWRSFWPVATPRQRAELLQGLSLVVVEGESGEILRSVPDPSGLPSAELEALSGHASGGGSAVVNLLGGADVPDP